MKLTPWYIGSCIVVYLILNKFIFNHFQDNVTAKKQTNRVVTFFFLFLL